MELDSLLIHSEWSEWGTIQGVIRREILKSNLKLYNAQNYSWILRHEFQLSKSVYEIISFKLKKSVIYFISFTNIREREERKQFILLSAPH